MSSAPNAMGITIVYKPFYEYCLVTIYILFGFNFIKKDISIPFCTSFGYGLLMLVQQWKCGPYSDLMV